MPVAEAHKPQSCHPNLPFFVKVPHCLFSKTVMQDKADWQSTHAPLDFLGCHPMYMLIIGHFYGGHKHKCAPEMGFQAYFLPNRDLNKR